MTTTRKPANKLATDDRIHGEGINQLQVVDVTILRDPDDPGVEVDVIPELHAALWDAGVGVS